jgi:two-component system, sensor histidine kinase and response regulator
MVVNAVDNGNTSHTSSLKILVVDDDEMNRRMMRLLLTRDGHDVQVAVNGMEALEVVKDQKFDVVFMDLQMPIMDGLEASYRIRKWENGGARTYIVALTASYLPEEGHLLFEAGIDNYISKPFEVDHIHRLLGLIAGNKLAEEKKGEAAPEFKAVPAEVLDVRKGIERVGGDLQAYKELLSDFIHELPERMKVLEQLSQQRDMISLARAAHNLKGVSLNLGALQLSEYAAKLDKQSNESYTDYDQALLLDLIKAETNLEKIATEFLVQGKTVAST